MATIIIGRRYDTYGGGGTDGGREAEGEIDGEHMQHAGRFGALRSRLDRELVKAGEDIARRHGRGSAAGGMALTRGAYTRAVRKKVRCAFGLTRYLHLPRTSFEVALCCKRRQSVNSMATGGGCLVAPQRRIY